MAPEIGGPWPPAISTRPSSRAVAECSKRGVLMAPAVFVHRPAATLKISAVASGRMVWPPPAPEAVSAAVPPVTNTLPLVRRVMVLPSRATLMGAVVVQVAVPGS